MNAKTTLLACLLAGFTLTPISAQTMKKGALISISTYTSILNPDVTMNQFLDFYMNKYIPEFEKNYPGIKLYVLTGDRGEKKNQFGYISF
jgi:ABC-type glycerol-3-phosphate transport system substrate-binding protein